MATTFYVTSILTKVRGGIIVPGGEEVVLVSLSTNITIRPCISLNTLSRKQVPTNRITYKVSRTWYTCRRILHTPTETFFVAERGDAVGRMRTSRPAIWCLTGGDGVVA